MGSTAETVFAVQGVRFAYPGQPPCLDGVSFGVRRGERLALVGANGSGKSTLLHLLDGLYFPAEGSVAYLGLPISQGTVGGGELGPRFRQEVGFLFQNSDAQLFCPSVEDELAFGPLQMGWTQDEVLRRIEDTLALLEIGGLRGRAPAALSAGEKKRVALASLLVLAPSVLLLDEPTAGLDPRGQSLLLEILEGLHVRGLTLVTATHDLTLLPHLADRVLVLSEEHRLVGDGDPERVLADTDLLLAVNLIHAHSHRHERLVHSHPHQHVVAHEHVHGHDHGHDHDE
jgi:cobalt/nickel transport system ATP-binding protein